MRLKNFLLVVEDIECSKAFYKDFFGLDVIRDFGTNVILAGGLVLQQRDGWEQLTGCETVFGGHNFELYFETNDMTGFLQKIQTSAGEIRLLNEAETYADRQVVRLYDPDGHVIEVAGISKN